MGSFLERHGARTLGVLAGFDRLLFRGTLPSIEYPARRLERAGIGHQKRDNCFTRVDDLPRARAMLVDLEQRNWVAFLNALARRLNPWMGRRSRLDLLTA